MIGEFKDSFRDQNGDMNIVFIVDEDTDLTKLEKLKGSDLLIKYERFTGKKTSKQNKYFWELMQGISKALKIKQWTAYLMILSDYGIFTDVELPEAAENDFKISLEDNYRYIKKMKHTFDGKIVLRCYKGLHLYSQDEARYLIDCAVQEAKDLGIETLPQYELNAMFRKGDV